MDVSFQSQQKPHSVHQQTSKTNTWAGSEMSSAEEAKVETDAISLKTPVSTLQEILVKHGKSHPKYQLVQIAGYSHLPFFKYRVSIDDGYDATGTGGNKRAAKHAAAQNLLDLLKGKHKLPEPTNQTDTTITNQEVSSCDDKVGGNPIGWLQEKCISCHWPTPFYKMVREEGPPHNKQFTVTCQLLKFSVTGTGKSKKLAKSMAAHKMCQVFQDGHKVELSAAEETNGQERQIGSLKERKSVLTDLLPKLKDLNIKNENLD